ncbi:Carboxymuconolactone decarboxylase family protein [Collimonas sp. OK607]|uniref:carboxymuconolactone decarboxylase family protein n=1 Tax=Collimonas sp. OK607 TaxID=1798194 RepID=UPI0008E5D8A7|nr:carboxymuconolactone decarboxylase family protein [Collimonas sp. OK607]SFB35560.1 Carboxymuconolactone decarboxylase family protein [Collimonas sp. OK607]
MITLEEMRSEALSFLKSCEEGDELDEQTAALIGLAVRASVSTLDIEGIDAYIERAFKAGATPAQVHETLVLISGLGVHTLMVGSRRVALIAQEQGLIDGSTPLDPTRKMLWARYVGEDPYWSVVEREAPGFLDALLRQSPEAFKAFFDYCAVPWKTGALPPVSKELISIAVDATTTHRYLPGMRLHLSNAVKLGVGCVAIMQALDIAAEAPDHAGIR